MRRMGQWFLLALLPLLLHAPPAASAVDLFLKVGDIKGESTDDQHKDWIDLLSYQFGASNDSSSVGGGAGAGKVAFSDFSFTKLVDASSPLLLQATASGKRFADAILDVVNVGGMGGSSFLTYTLENVSVTSFSQSSGGDIPLDSFSLNFDKIRMDYRPQLQDGSLGPAISMSWDLKQAAPVPEPSTWAMLVAGLAFVAFRGRRILRLRAA